MNKTDTVNISDYVLFDQSLIARLSDSKIDQNLINDVIKQFLFYQNVVANYLSNDMHLLDDCQALRAQLDSYKRAIKVLIPLHDE